MSKREHITSLLHSDSLANHKLALSLLQGQKDLMPADFEAQLLDFYQWLWPHHPWGNPNTPSIAEEIVLQLLTLKNLQLGPRHKPLHEGVGLLFCLERLSIDHAQLTTLPDSLVRLHLLASLSLADNQLSSLPAGFEQLSSLRILDLRYNHFQQLPAACWALPQLESLFVDHNPLQHLPAPKAGQLPRFQALHATHCQLQQLPATFWLLPALSFVHLSHNNLQTLPKTTQQPRFRHLSLDYNAALDLSTLFCDTLYLRIDHCPCTTLPSGIRAMPSLERLSIVGLPLAQLPTWLLELPALQQLFTKGCFLEDAVARELAARGVGVW